MLPEKVIFPPITPEEQFKQDKAKREWDDYERTLAPVSKADARHEKTFGKPRP